jgi:peptide subunit release factor 1 (eRF1)
MLRPQDLADLVETDRRDVISISLDVDATKPENQSEPPAYLIWLRNALRATVDRLFEDKRRVADEPAMAVIRFVESMKPAGRGLAIFAGPDLWRQYVLPFPLPNRVAHGRPDLIPLLWAIDEYQPYAVLVVDREHARILVSTLGAARVVEEEVLQLDTSDWRFKAGRQPTFTKATGTGASRGTQRDTFDARVEDHVRRFWQSAAEAAGRWLDELQIHRLIIGGQEEAANTVREMLPEPARRKVVGIVPLPAHAEVSVIRERTLPIALEEERRRDIDLVAQVLEGAKARSGGVVGKAATVEALMEGQALRVVADRDLAGEVWQCTQCQFVSGRAVKECPACGGTVETLPLSQALPLLARRGGATIEFVGDEAAEGLRPHDGLGAILRYVTTPLAG